MSAAANSDEQGLARLARDGSATAFDQLVGLHHRRVFAFLLALVRHRQDAEDLTQDTFLRAWSKIHRYNPELPILPWLFTIARRLSIAALRRKRPLPPEALEPADPEPPDRALWLWEIARSHLKPDAYAALWLHYREEMSVHEISEIMGKREGAIKVILHRARQSLAERFRGHDFSSAVGDFSEPQRLMP